MLPDLMRIEIEVKKGRLTWTVFDRGRFRSEGHALTVDEAAKAAADEAKRLSDEDNERNK